MIQGGDPTGTGRGGESIWGGKFEDEVGTGKCCPGNRGMPAVCEGEGVPAGRFPLFSW